ncbi:MAG: toxic anion resistance protein [Eubacteriaceae bacterium]|jgi:uncharacterized protein YaaN involved in tellurite resistance|nr:toxic anion resistance protein [Eubacteriaceae bacterium]
MNNDLNQPTPTLTLDPFGKEGEAAPKTVNTGNLAPEQAKFVEEANLTPQEEEMVNNFVGQIDITNSNMVMQYGTGAQKKIADFSDTALNSVRSQDLGEVGDMLSGMVVELKKFDVDDKKGFHPFRKAGNKIAALKARYADAETNINKICDVLEGHQIKLLKDVAIMDKLYETNLTYFKELSMYIVAGKRKLALVRANDLPKLVQKSQASGLPEDAQAANDLASMCNRFEKKIHDLELTRTVAMQTAPQIRLVQNNDTLMAEKIQSSLVNTIPLWKSQMVLALGIAHSTEAAKAQREVTNMTNDLLKKNAETLKINTIETAKESERGVVDIDTLKKTNESLISTFDEVLRIQEDGRKQRQQAEAEMGAIEGELKNKLLEISQRNV